MKKEKNGYYSRYLEFKGRGGNEKGSGGRGGANRWRRAIKLYIKPLFEDCTIKEATFAALSVGDGRGCECNKMEHPKKIVPGLIKKMMHPNYHNWNKRVTMATGLQSRSRHGHQFLSPTSSRSLSRVRHEGINYKTQ